MGLGIRFHSDVPVTGKQQNGRRTMKRITQDMIVALNSNETFGHRQIQGWEASMYRTRFFKEPLRPAIAPMSFFLFTTNRR